MKKYTENHGMYDIGIFMWDQIPQKIEKKKKKTIEFRDFLQFLPYLTGL